jgi:hypothetical protein
MPGQLPAIGFGNPGRVPDPAFEKLVYSFPAKK